MIETLLQRVTEVADSRTHLLLELVPARYKLFHNIYSLHELCTRQLHKRDYIHKVKQLRRLKREAYHIQDYSISLARRTAARKLMSMSAVAALEDELKFDRREYRKLPKCGECVGCLKPLDYWYEKIAPENLLSAQPNLGEAYLAFQHYLQTIEGPHVADA